MQISLSQEFQKLLHTVAVESPESSVATFKPFERVETLVSGTLYSDCNNRKKSEIITCMAKNTRNVFPPGKAFIES